MSMDLRYIDTWSLRQDLKIILKTFEVVARGQGAY
jgi:lipopolysaccharide/colanic/teichoic acid biosynthesis glycosyltransferase